MSIVELKVDIINGSGGPNNDAIPIYGDNKAPNGGWRIGPNGKQLMLENSDISGKHYLIVDTKLLTSDENQGNKFVTWKLDGQPNYVRLWFINQETGHGEDYNGNPMWAEYSHIKILIDEPLEPPASDTSTLIVDWVNRTVTVSPA